MKKGPSAQSQPGCLNKMVNWALMISLHTIKEIIKNRTSEIKDVTTMRNQAIWYLLLYDNIKEKG